MAAGLVIVVRLLVPLTIFRWPLGGALASMIVDALDVVLVDGLARLRGEPPEFGPIYAQLDKWLDLYYLSIEAYIAWRWSEALLRRTALLLFAWRLLGVVVFETTGIRETLVVFPNLFENFYLYVLLDRRLAPRFLPRTVAQMLFLLLVLYIPKAIQAWVLHWEQLHPWEWLRDTFIRPAMGG